MGTYFNKPNIESPEIGDNLKSQIKDFIQKTDKILDSNEKNSFTHLRVKQSINKDLKSLKACTEKGGNLKIGIISRTEDVTQLVNTLYLDNLHTDTNRNTLISSKNIKDKTILSNNNIQQDSEQSISKLMSSSLKDSVHKNQNILITKFFPGSPDIINDNLMLTCSSNLKTIHSHLEHKIEIDIDDMNKFLLFSALHDLLIYLPDKENLKNEISYLDLLSDNMLILKLLRRGNFYIVNRKFSARDIDVKLNDLIIKLGKTVVHQLNYEKAEEDKVRYLGVMIEKYGTKYVKNISYDNLKRIKLKFDDYLKQNEFKEYMNKISNEEKHEEEKAILDPNYIKKEITKLGFHEFKRDYVNKFFTFGQKFKTTSGIDHLEESLTNSFMQIINNKFSILRSNISFKIMLYENLEELEGCNEFLNSLVLTRTQIVEDIEKSFGEMTNYILNEENILFTYCDKLMNEITNLRTIANDFKGESSFLNIFNLYGNQVPFNQYLKNLRNNYYSFNGVVFRTLTKISNGIYRNLDILTKRISNYYTALFLEIENKSLSKIISGRNRTSFYDFNMSSDYLNNLSIQEIINSKIEKVNVLAINLFSAFGYSNFLLDGVYPYYLIPSYGGPLVFLTFSLLSEYLSTPLRWFGFNIFRMNLTGAFILLSSFLLAEYLEQVYRKNSKENFMINSEKLLSFMALKKDKVMYLKDDLNNFCKIYSKETLELIDLILGIE